MIAAVRHSHAISRENHSESAPKATRVLPELNHSPLVLSRVSFIHSEGVGPPVFICGTLLQH